MYSAIDKKSLPKEELKFLTKQRDHQLDMAQLLVGVAQAQEKLVADTIKRLAKQYPQSRLLPK